MRDAFGARRAYAGAGLLLSIGLVGSALATDMPTLVGWRLIQGIGGGAMAAGVAACAPVNADVDRPAAGGLSERMVSFAAPGGTMDGFFVHPADRASPLVLLWPDIAGLREAKRQMARRLAGEGYAVFVANPYYRDVAGEQFADFAAFAAADGFQTVRPWRAKLDAPAIQADARAATAWLDTQDGVDTARGIGTQGYCMGGPLSLIRI